MDTKDLLDFSPPIPSILFPTLAFLFFLAGFVLTSAFSFIPAKVSMIKELLFAIPASILLGFGSVFLSLSVGIYV
ncbi:5535_t:CDS:2 [Diversispora eburnea]|uniref:Dolichyl-diphosphooligosaccharide-protein glycosyltransferase subunit OST5 n=1 Tax=Diversispora eburnea TaxID=1213867 RepID=A0A9N8UZ12_9GLOM|nr:5535_t:CDS:2 [Diversispora eburnea]